MDACVVVFPGSNCDRDVKVALEAVAGRPVRMVWHADTTVPACDIIVLPGGFAYGDYLRCGAMAAHSPVMRDVVARAKRGTPVLGMMPHPERLFEPMLGGSDGRKLFESLLTTLH